MSVSVAGVTAVVGAGAAVYGASQSGKAGQAAAGAQRDGDMAAMMADIQDRQFQMENYNKLMGEIDSLEGIFGPIRENLGDYYKNMSPEKYQLEGKENIEAQYERSNKQLDAVFSNNGMFNSGQALNAKMALEVSREVAMGNNQQNSMNEYLGEQRNWLNFGSAEQMNLRNLQNGQMANISSSYQNQANRFQQSGANQANMHMQTAQGYNQMASGGLQLAGYAMGGGFNTNNAGFGGKTSVDVSGMGGQDWMGYGYGK